MPLPTLRPSGHPRPLKKLLKEAENAVQVRRAGLDKVVAELAQHASATDDPVFKSALDRLRDVLSRFLQNPSQGMAADVLVSVDAVRRVSAEHEPPTARKRFWQR
jgi:hypothetical protein